MVFKMEEDLGRIKSLPLSYLPLRTRELLSCLLDTPKIIPTDGPVKLPRDWRGLADLVNVSSERAAYIRLQPQKTVKVLEIWQKDSSATVGHLMQHLERLDRFDVYDDLCDDLKEAISKGELLDKPQANEQNQIAIINNHINNNHHIIRTNDEERDFDPITFDDGPDYEHHYDAFVLYAKEDQQFVNELLSRMSAEGFQLCTEDRLQPGHATPYAPITKLMLERCKRIILICSPDFLLVESNKYYSEYAQAVSIESHNHKIIPIMYRECKLPSNLAFVHKLHYNKNENMYDFWRKLKQSLQTARDTPIRPRIANINKNIVELLPSNVIADYSDEQLFLPSPPNTSLSMSSLNVKAAADTNSLSSMSQQSVTSSKKKKKSKIIRRVLKYFRPSKSEEAIMVAH
ncbi:unnamed protein product [Spodoptera littoralis]|uniref:Myeloid differentiation primary response protein MyD88 n=1 Tax=Spodoptera littoralis TaxID=7109 RepID=A0A9P0N9F4_SPOLI|nr:unnamed protein product [Spodoptera littoralis]CAH1646345.1 unnamed protein product [Spodoptera littoralis]